jgi:hypothetical protein
VAGITTAVIDTGDPGRAQPPVLHVIGGRGHWTMIEKTTEFLAVV